MRFVVALALCFAAVGQSPARAQVRTRSQLLVIGLQPAATVAQLRAALRLPTVASPERRNDASPGGPALAVSAIELSPPVAAPLAASTFDLRGWWGRRSVAPRSRGPPN
jgi:hypothetical protein